MPEPDAAIPPHAMEKRTDDIQKQKQPEPQPESADAQQFVLRFRKRLFQQKGVPPTNSAAASSTAVPTPIAISCTVPISTLVAVSSGLASKNRPNIWAGKAPIRPTPPYWPALCTLKSPRI